MATKRKNEAAWVESRKRWQINVQKDGVRKTFACSIAGRKGKIECERKADEWLLHSLVNESTKTAVVLDAWFENLKANTSTTHVKQQKNYIENWIKPAIGHKRVGSLTHGDLQAVIDDYNRFGNRGKGLSKKTLTNIKSCLSAFMKYCRSIQCSTLTPEFMKVPKSATTKEKQILTPEDLAILFSSNRTKSGKREGDDFFVNAYRFAVVTGLRPGELIALQNGDIQGDTLVISRSINDENEVTQGKNENARRSMRISDTARAILEDQKAMLERSGVSSLYVFPRADGRYIAQDCFRKAWTRYREYNGIQGAPTPYELRHTFVSITGDMPIDIKKQVVGHSKNMDTLGVYGHQKKGDLDRAAAYIDAAFSAFKTAKSAE